MITPTFHDQRRSILTQKVSGPILLMGNGLLYRNVPNHLPFRQDSTFLYYTGCTLPDAAVLLHNGTTTFFLQEVPEGDELWHGPSPSIDEIGKTHGFDTVLPFSEITKHCEQIKDPIHCLAVSDPNKNRVIQQICGCSLTFGERNGSDQLIDAVIQMRRQLQPEEIENMRETAKVTHAAHVNAMKATVVGGHERDVAVTFDSTIARAGLTNAYGSIVTVDGHILHNFHHVNTLKSGQLLLLDGGAESKAGYATDVTRTWPVNGRFTDRQAAVYAAVLEAEKKSIDMVRVGARYRHIHDQSSRIIASFLKDEGLLKVSADEAVEIGAHALFFPHGVGHIIALDVHDMEVFGDRATYPPGRQRSSQFGTAYLRLDMDLLENMVVTIEPGFYIAPEIINNATLRERFKDAIHFDRVEKWFGFGGIRIEDDVHCTKDGPDVLTKMIPKEINEIEALVGSE